MFCWRSLTVRPHELASLVVALVMPIRMMLLADLPALFQFVLAAGGTLCLWSLSNIASRCRFITQSRSVADVVLGPVL